jgi:hypothetical protein
MKKSTIVPIIVFLVIAGLTYGVLANSHIEIFPGEVCEQIITGGPLSCAPETVSLLDHNRGVTSYGSELFNAFGWIVFAIVVIGIPAGIAGLLHKKMGK